jgi:hypothetical protein
VIVDEMRGDENQKLTHLSGEMKHLAAVTNSVVIASAATPKGSMRRGLDQDAVKGPGGSTYDAKLIATAFSDVKVNRSNAQIFHDAELPHNPGTVQRLPVIELDIAKNKVDAFQDIIFYKFVPEYAYIEEAPEQWQEAWRQVLYGASTAREMTQSKHPALANMYLVIDHQARSRHERKGPACSTSCSQNSTSGSSESSRLPMRSRSS